MELPYIIKSNMTRFQRHSEVTVEQRQLEEAFEVHCQVWKSMIHMSFHNKCLCCDNHRGGEEGGGESSQLSSLLFLRCVHPLAERRARSPCRCFEIVMLPRKFKLNCQGKRHTRTHSGATTGIPLCQGGCRWCAKSPYTPMDIYGPSAWLTRYSVTMVVLEYMT